MRASLQRSSFEDTVRIESDIEPAMPTPHEEHPLLRQEAQDAWKPPVGFVWIQLGLSLGQ